MSAVRVYTSFLTSGFNRSGDPQRDQFSDETIMRILRAGSTARVYEVAREIYQRIVLDCAHEAVRAIARGNPSLDLTNVDALRIDLTTIAAQLPFQGPLPFPSCFIAFDKPIPLADPIRMFEHNASSLALLLFQDDAGTWCFEYIRDPRSFWVTNIHGPDGWCKPCGVSVLSIPELLIRLMKPSLRQRHLTTTERYQVKRAAKKHKRRISTMPYYVVDISDDEVLDDDIGDEPTGVQVMRAAPSPPDHRFDVAAHQRLLLERGTERPDPAMVLRFMLQGWEFWRNDLPPRWMAQLRARGIPAKQADEWMLLMLATVKPHLRGPEDRPYVPAVRRLG